MWLTKQRMSEGPVFGSVDKFEGLGVFFDTYDNERAHVSLLKFEKDDKISKYIISVTLSLMLWLCLVMVCNHTTTIKMEAIMNLLVAR